MVRKTIVLVLLVACVAGVSVWRLGSSSSSRSNPAPSARTVRVTDLAGRDVTIRKPVERIALMRSLNIYELAAVLGDELGGKLIGWDSSLKTGDLDAHRKFVERFPQLKDATILGDVLRDTVSAEAVLALNPDLVIMSTSMLERKSRSLEQLEQAGVPLLYLDFSDPFKGPQRSLLLLGQVLDKETQAQAIVHWIDRELDKVFSRLEKIESKVPTLYLEAGTQGAGRYGNTFGRDGQGKAVNWGSVMDQVRCRNVAADAVSGLYGMAVIRPEFLLKADPQVIVVTGAHWTAFPDSLHLGYDAEAAKARGLLREFATRPGWADLQAVKNRRVYGIHTRFGSHVTSFAAAQQLAKWLYPTDFQDLEPEAALRRFHDKFMPIGFSGTWMVGIDDD